MSSHKTSSVPGCNDCAYDAKVTPGPTAGERRAARKAARAAGQPLTGELALITGEGHPFFAPVRTSRQEAKHERGMDRWARRYDELNGAPEGPDDY